MGAQMGGGQGGLFNVGKSKAVKATKVKTKFADVAGLHEAKVTLERGAMMFSPSDD